MKVRGRKIKENMILHKKQKVRSEFGKRVKVLRPTHQSSSTAATTATAGYQGSPSTTATAGHQGSPSLVNMDTREKVPSSTQLRSPMVSMTVKSTGVRILLSPRNNSPSPSAMPPSDYTTSRLKSIMQIMYHLWEL